jgi:hypothetical protein
LKNKALRFPVRITQKKLATRGGFCIFLTSADALQHQPTNNMKANNATETTQVQIASAMDDCGTNEIRTIEMTKADEKEYNDGMAKLAEMWG